MNVVEFGPYRLERLVGRGGMGEVFEAYDSAQDRQVAVKRLISHVADDPEFQKRFRRESRLAARLRNPHVIPIHSYGEIDGQLFIDMRLIEGCDLEKLLVAEGAQTPERTVDIIEQVASALDAAHRDGLIHRDVKPSNILLDRNVGLRDFAYLADFGITRLATGDSQSLTSTHAIVGSLDYMAPEQFEGRIGPEVDIYSLGCVFFQCLTGSKPFVVEGLPALMRAHMTLDPPVPSERLPEVGVRFDKLMKKALAKDPAQRYATAGALAAAARGALGHEERIEGRHEVHPPAFEPRGNTDVAPSPDAAPAPEPERPERPRADPAPARESPEPPTEPPAPATADEGGRPHGRERRRGPLLFVGGAVIAALLAVGAWAGLRSGSTDAAPPTTPQAAAAAAPAPTAVARSVPVPTLGTPIPAGRTPGYAAVSPNGRLVYIANRDAGVVTLVDTAINQVTATIPVAAGPPQYLTFAPDGRHVYISVFDTARTVHAVAVLDTTTNDIVATVPVRTRPFAAAVTPDGRALWVPNHDSGTISVIDTASNALVREVPVPPNPHWIAFSHDGTRAYTTNHESNVVSVIDTATFAVVAQVPVDRSPHSLAVHPQRPLVANVNYDSDSVTMIDTTTNAVVARVPVGRYPQNITWAPDGRFAYVADNQGNTVSVIDAQSFRVTATLPTPPGPTAVAVTPDGRTAYVTCTEGGVVAVLDLTN